MSRVEFKRLTEADFPMLAEWLARPHVAGWWDSRSSIEQVREDFLPLLQDTSTTIPYIAFLDGLPLGYIQSYVAAESEDGWWPDEHDPGVRGIDQFLADEGDLNKGLGTTMIAAFVDLLFEAPDVTKIQTDPAPDNARAIRCYEKCGFQRAGRVITPDGDALLMVRRRQS
jgi:RimJ/RimL family protein N-acetyltransferase